MSIIIINIYSLLIFIYVSFALIYIFWFSSDTGGGKMSANPKHRTQTTTKKNNR